MNPLTLELEAFVSWPTWVLETLGPLEEPYYLLTAGISLQPILSVFFSSVTEVISHYVVAFGQFRTQAGLELAAILCLSFLSAMVTGMVQHAQLDFVSF